MNESSFHKPRDCADRLQMDISATLSLTISWDWRPNHSLEVSFDGKVAGSIEPAQADCAWLADHLQDQYIIEYLGAAWPRCTAHGRHPMVARNRGGTAVWECPKDVGISTPIGMLTLPSVDEPTVPDDHVRWWSDEWGWGVIAHSKGDIFAHFSSVVGAGYRSLTEGQHVRCRVVKGQQGRGFHRVARRVKVIS